MSKCKIGIDIGNGKDESVYTVVRGPRWYEKVMKNIDSFTGIISADMKCPRCTEPMSIYRPSISGRVQNGLLDEHCRKCGLLYTDLDIFLLLQAKVDEVIYEK